MTEDERRKKIQAIFVALRAVQDGVITPDEANDLCKAGVVLLQSIRPQVKKYWAKIALDTACVVLKDLGEDIRRNHGTNTDQ